MQCLQITAALVWGQGTFGAVSHDEGGDAVHWHLTG